MSSQRRGRKKQKTGMVVIPLDDDPSDGVGPSTTPTISVPSVHYDLRADSMSFSVSTTRFDIPRDHPLSSSASESVNNPDMWNYEYVSDDLPLDVDPKYLDQVEGETVTEKRPRMNYNPLKRWLLERDIFLAEFLRLEGRGNPNDTTCPLHSEPVVYRCCDCDIVELLCKSCILLRHQHNFLHHLEEWTGTYFKKTSLKSLGLRVQLGHPPGETCSNFAPGRVSDDFMVIHVNGIHEVSVDFCDCTQKQPPFIQLLRQRWFPASVDRPRTAATLSVLKLFQMISFESKASALEFYNGVKRLTDNTGMCTPKSRYPAFMVMVREYRHLKMTKRAGRGHDPAGITSTKQGECAVLCPACPQPGLNLPPGWETVAPEIRFLYCLFLALDANFRLKRKNVSSEAMDPSLSQGWSYFAPEQRFKKFLKVFDKVIVQPKSTCSSHNAVNAERATKGLAATGVVAIDCARHDCKRPLSVGDLLKGERYINVDYLFLLSLSNHELLSIVVSYDIVCQWSVHVWERMAQYPHKLHIDHDGKVLVRFLIPKFHLPAHIRPCQTTYSFNYNVDVGRTDGEGVERGWSHINPVATSTREMGPGHRRDTLDDHFGDWNWKKTCLMGVTLLRKIKEAVKEANEHHSLHAEFEAGLDKESVDDWRLQLSRWEVNHTQKNPYEKEFKEISQDGVRKRLANEEAADLKAGRAYALHHDISACELITMGLDFEQKQRRLAVDYAALGQHATDKQKGQLQAQANALRRKITAWIEVQHLYVPGLAAVRAHDIEVQGENEDPVQDIPLYLPSDLHSSSGPPCDLRLRSMEWDLRNAQASDALAELRDGLRLRAYLYHDKDRFQRGQRQNTRSRGIITRMDTKIKSAAAKYRAARKALGSLAFALEKLGWETLFPVLLDGDIRALDEAQASAYMRPTDARPSKGRTTISWIWMKIGDLEQRQDECLRDDLRIEWCKSKARADRWREEVLLLREEMRRVSRYDDDVTHDGRRAYANEQAAMLQEMERYFHVLWRHVEDYVLVGSGVVIPSEVIDAEHNDDEDGL
ncbi:hypothetical protein FPV67DRAFT_1671429 [Lyophyllum atratum]|nr:hypothetical protein FPV67DRAFT_1671429 [Lyophyllum atratum]